ncbi:MAG: SpoIIE family protein phosphatase, partial [Imperialibacter sp.]
KSILFLLLVIIYLWYFFMSLVGYSNESVLITDLLNDVFVLSVFAFIFIYSVFSVLVILFNLPTSSVFESKLEEVINFQRLSQTIPTGQKEEQVFEILLDSAVSAVFADAAWLEITDTKAGKQELLVRNLNPDLIDKIKEAAQNSTLKRILNSELERNPTSQKLTATLKKVPFKSVLVYPIIVKNQQIGTLALLKEVDDSFNKEMIDIINTYVNQASISIENFRLLTEALENERYKEELKIASRVQKSLLPQTLDKNHDYNITAFSMAADEVGGDYYDTFRINDNKVALIIADVSGKGTSAAFHMSQMKGIFHSLAQLDLEPKEFMVKANSALSRCLEKTSFITASYFIIDTKSKVVRFTRAGHCPTLYLDGRTRETSFFKNKGLGLGILRNSSFEDYVQVNEFYYKPGDVFVLYTDGITEATNQDQEEFGYDRLRTSLLRHANLTPDKIKDGIIDDLYDFCGKRSLDDDYTMLIVKFNEHENVKSVESVKTKK